MLAAREVARSYDGFGWPGSPRRLFLGPMLAVWGCLVRASVAFRWFPETGNSPVPGILQEPPESYPGCCGSLYDGSKSRGKSITANGR